MTLLQSRPDTSPDSSPDPRLDAAAGPVRPAGPVRIRFHDGATTSLPVPGKAGGGSPARRRLWSLGTSDAALDLALDRMIEQAAREIRGSR